MRKVLVIVSCIVLTALSFGCKDGNSSNTFSGSQWNYALSPSNEALERSIIADIMGGIAAAIIQPEEMSLSGLSDVVEDEMLDEETPAEEEEASGEDAAEEEADETEEVVEETSDETIEEGDTAEEEVEANKLSISVPLESAYTQSNDTFTYDSPEGSGTLTITVSGMMEEVDVGQTDNEMVRFFPLRLHLIYENYDYTNSCGRRAVINGTISCKITGTHYRSSDVIDARGNCSSGSEGMGGSLLYTLNNQESHELRLQASVDAGGPWYELTSYHFIGNYTLDQRSGNIDTVLARPPGLCTEAY